MVAYTVNAAAVGTVLVAGAGSISSITVAALPAGVDPLTPVTIVDAATAAAGQGLGQGSPHTLICSYWSNLQWLFEPRTGFTAAGGPNSPAPTYPRGISNLANAFSYGMYVKSCPAGLTLTVNA